MSEVKQAWDEFSACRRLTTDLLNILTAEQLLWSPSENVGQLWKQFRHMGRVQENYIKAIETGEVVFNTTDDLIYVRYTGGSDQKLLLGYLHAVAELSERIIFAANSKATINWFGEKVTLSRHIAILNEHEVLHHGQWILQARLLGLGLPASWEIWGE